MSGVSRGNPPNGKEIDGQISTGTDKFVRITRINGQRISFRDLALFAWPEKTESFLAHITKYDARTCRRWISPNDPTEPPAEALGAVIAEIMRRFHMREN
jgi:hypothetical protein